MPATIASGSAYSVENETFIPTRRSRLPPCPVTRRTTIVPTPSSVNASKVWEKTTAVAMTP